MAEEESDFEFSDVLNSAGSDGLTSLARKNGHVLTKEARAGFDPEELDSHGDMVDNLAEYLCPKNKRTPAQESAIAAFKLEQAEMIEREKLEAVEDVRQEIIVSTVQTIRDELDADPKPHLALRCMGLVCDSLIAEGFTQTTIARIFRVTRQAVSKRVIKFSDAFGIVSRVMKSRSAREKYRTPDMKHWNQRKRSDYYHGKNGHQNGSQRSAA